jgi:hypothetical protein
VIRTLTVLGIADDGRVAGRDEVTGFISDEEACALAQHAFPHCAAVELWVGRVMVARAAGVAHALACRRT